MHDERTALEELQEFLARYTTAFLTLSPGRIAGFYQAPCLSISAKELIAYQTAADVHANFTNVADQFRASGLRTLQWELVDVRVYGPDLFDVRVVWSARFEAKAAVHTLDNVYTLRRERGELKIVSVVLVH